MTTEHRTADADLASRLREGDVTAYEELYRRHGARLYNLAYRMLGQAADAEDLLQETFLQVFRRIDTFKGEAAFGTWLYRMAMNLCLDRLRSKAGKTDRQTTSIEDVREYRLAGRGPLDSVKRLDLERAIARLPDACRAAFLLHDVEGFEHQEVGRLLGVSDGTSKSQVHKARMRIRAFLLGETAGCGGAVWKRPVMTCDTFLERASDYVDGTLDEATRAEADAHVDECDACRDLAADLRKVQRSAGALDRVPPAANAWVRILDRLQADPAFAMTSASSSRLPAPRTSGYQSLAWLAMAAALLLAIGTALVYVVKQPAALSSGSGDHARCRHGSSTPTTRIPSKRWRGNCGRRPPTTRGQSQASSRCPRSRIPRWTQT